MKRLRFVFLAIILLLNMFVFKTSVLAEEEAVSISLSCGSDCYVGGEARITIKVSMPSAALAGLEFVLNYDSEYLSPLVTENTEEGREMDALISTSPDGWEQMSIHYENRGYRFRFAADKVQNSFLDKENELVLEIPFKVIKAGSFDFSIPDKDIIAVSADAKNSLLSGKGSEITVHAASEGQKLSAELFGDATAGEKGKYELGINITNLGDTAGIVAFEFKLLYDKSVFAPTVTQNSNGEMDVFLKDTPSGAWEQLCTHDEKNGVYTLRIAAKKAESTTESARLLSGETLRIYLPFTIIAQEGAVGSFSVNGKTLIGLNNINGIVSGSGSDFSVSVEKRAVGISPEELGYKVENGILCYVSEKTAASELLAEFVGYSLTDANGNEIKDTVCTGNILSDGTNSYTVCVLGDINKNGSIDTYDYILAARIYFGTFTPSPEQTLAANVNGDALINQYDYLLIKRHYFKTYEIKVNK